MSIALLAIAALLLVAIGVQVGYAHSYWASATNATKVVWSVNITLLTALVAGLVWYVTSGAGAI